MEDKMREVTLKLPEVTFQHLEVLAIGLLLERFPREDRVALVSKYVDSTGDFVPAVASLLEEVAGSLAEGVSRSGSWERQTVVSLTGWEGTVNQGMFGDLVDMGELVEIE